MLLESPSRLRRLRLLLVVVAVLNTAACVLPAEPGFEIPGPNRVSIWITGAITDGARWYVQLADKDTVFVIGSLGGVYWDRAEIDEWRLTDAAIASAEPIAGLNPDIWCDACALLLTARQIGTTELLVREDTAHGRAQIVVVPRIVSVDLRPANPTLYVGDTLTLEAVLVDGDGGLVGRTGDRCSRQELPVGWHWVEAERPVHLALCPNSETPLPPGQTFKVVGDKPGAVQLVATAFAAADTVTIHVLPREGATVVAAAGTTAGHLTTR